MAARKRKEMAKPEVVEEVKEPEIETCKQCGATLFVEVYVSAPYITEQCTGCRAIRHRGME